MHDALLAVPLFAGLPETTLATLADIGRELRLRPGQALFAEGDPGDEAYVVLEGEVHIVKEVAAGLRRTLAVLEPGSLFGEAAIFDRELRSAGAVAEGEVRLAVLPAEPLKDWLLEHSGVGAMILGRLGSVMLERLRSTNQLLSEAIAWGNEVAGAARVGLGDLVRRSQVLSVQLVTGRELTGRLVKAEPGPAGLELSLVTDDGRLHILRYDAVAELVVEANLVAPTEEG